MTTGAKVECRACGQMYGTPKKTGPWPPCPKCKGELFLVPEIKEPDPDEFDEPLAVAPMDVFSQIDVGALSAANPLASTNTRRSRSAGQRHSGPSTTAVIVGGGGLLMAFFVLMLGAGVALQRAFVARVMGNMQQHPVYTNIPPSWLEPPSNANKASFKLPEKPQPETKSPVEERPTAKTAEDMVKSLQEKSLKSAKVEEDDESKESPNSPSVKKPSIARAPGLGFQDSSKQAGFEPRTPWQVMVDPAPESDSLVSERLLEIDFKTRVDQLVFPDRPSPFFAAASDEFRKQEVRIFDLRTGRSTRKIPGELHHNKRLSCLNADGEHMATVIQGEAGPMIVIASTRTGKMVHTINVGEKDTVKELAFAGPQRFIAVVENGRGSESEIRLGVWDLAERKSITEFALQNPLKDRWSSNYFYKEGSLAVSPGGKYFFVALSNVLEFYEAESGQLAGQIQIAEVSRHLESPAFAFSPDAKELTVMHGSRATDAMLFRIDVSNGEVIGATQINTSEFKETPNYYNTLSKVQYISDLDCYLIDGTFVVERTSGEALYRLDAFSGMACVIGNSRVVGVVKRDRAAGLAEFRLPREEIEKLAAILRGGGKLLDGIWGEAKSSDLNGAKQLTQPISATPWNLVLSPAVERQSARKFITLPVPFDERNSWHIDPPLFSSLGGKIAWLPWSERSHSRLNVVDVTNGTAEGNLDMLPGSRVLDISPEGSLVIAGLGKKSAYFGNYAGNDATFERLEVFSIAQQKHVLAWKVHMTVGSEAKTTNYREADPRLFRKAFFLEKTLVLTQMDGGRLILWKLPEAKALWVFDGKTTIAGFTPDRSHVLLHSAEMKKFSWLELRTGQWAGDLPGDDKTTTALAFSPDRSKFASLLTCNGYSQIVIRKVGQEEPIFFDVPGLGNSLEWLDDRFLIGLREGVVFDSENGAPVWRIQFDGNVVRAPDSTCWHYGGKPGSLVLTRTNIPSDTLTTKLRAVKTVPLKPLVARGSRVAIRGGFPTDPEAMKQIEREFDRRGWVLDPNSSVGINAVVTQEPSKSVDYQNLLTRETTNVTVQGASVVTISVSATNGQEFWKTTYRISSGAAPSSVMLRSGEDLQSKINSYSQFGPLTINSIPDIIFPADSYQRLTTSRVNEKGEQF